MRAAFFAEVTRAAFGRAAAAQTSNPTTLFCRRFVGRFGRRPTRPAFCHRDQLRSLSPSPAFGFFLRNATLAVTLFDVAGMPLLFVRAFRFISAWHFAAPSLPPNLTRNGSVGGIIRDRKLQLYAGQRGMSTEGLAEMRQLADNSSRRHVFCFRILPRRWQAATGANHRMEQDDAKLSIDRIAALGFAAPRGVVQRRAPLATRGVAQRQTIARGAGDRQFIDRFESNARYIATTYQAVIESVREQQTIRRTPNGLVDNYYVVQEQLRGPPKTCRAASTSSCRSSPRRPLPASRACYEGPGPRARAPHR